MLAKILLEWLTLCKVIGQATIEQIFSAARIEEVVGDYVQLKRSGSGLGGLCPFHNEKTPSFKVSPNLGIYKCFGCGRGGNVVDFIMEHERVSYPEALKQLASKYHIEIEEDFSSNKEELSEQVKLREGLYASLEYARKYFNENLSSEEGELIGKSYFVERGVTSLSIDEFDLGYASGGWRNFLEKSHTDGFDLGILLQAGLIKQKNETEEGSSNLEDYYDAYRERVIFPIHNANGKVVGFGGRQLKKSEKSPKYINSPENEVYHKSKVLYGLYQARHEIRGRDDCYLVEGYMDVVMLAQSGIKNVVASSGTALTEDQVKLIKRFTDNVTLLFDGDPAGLKAALRGVDMLLAGDLNVKVVVFPEGEDPDSYCRKLGGQGLEDFITANKKDVVNFMTDLLLEEHGNDAPGISDTAHKIVDTIVKIQDPIKRNAYITQTADRLNIDRELLNAEVRKAGKKLNRFQKKVDQLQDQKHLLLPKVDKDPERIKEERNKEMLVLKSLIKYAQLPYKEEVDVATFIFSEFQSDNYSFENSFVGKIISEAATHYQSNGRLDEKFFIQHPEAGHLAADVLSKKYELSASWLEKYDIPVDTDEQNYPQEIQDNLNYLKLYKVDEVISRNELAIKGAKSEEEILSVQKRHVQLLELRTKIASLLGNVVLK